MVPTENQQSMLSDALFGVYLMLLQDIVPLNVYNLPLSVHCFTPLPFQDIADTGKLANWLNSFMPKVQIAFVMVF